MTHARTLRDSPQGDVSALSIAVVGLARNCGKTLRADIHRIKKAVEGAREVQWLIVESDSTDDTVSELEALRAELRNFQFASLGKLATTIPSLDCSAGSLAGVVGRFGLYVRIG
jgi:glycosyltransferase involved in cell wall biosynthesis